MAGQSPADALAKIQRVITGWDALAKEESFRGMTLDQFKAAVKPSFDARDEVRKKENELKAAQDARDSADEASLELSQKIVRAVVDSDNYGDDSPLYEAMGYIRKSERKSGLTRKKTATAKPMP